MKLRLTHVHVFLIGWAYYLGGPVMIAYLGLLNAVESADAWLKYVDTEGDLRWALPLYVLLMPLAFMLGDRMSGLIKPARPHLAYVRRANWVLWPLYVVLLGVLIFLAGDLMFSGYVGGYDPAIMGPIATLQLLILFQYLLFKSSGLRVAARLNLVLLLVCSVVLLSMGGRLYVATSLAAILFYKWNWEARATSARRRALMWAFFAVVAFAVLGMLRMGVFSPFFVLLYMFLEPFFTSISAFSVMRGDWTWLADSPNDFLVAFVNIVPSWFWPGKADFITSSVEEFSVFSPFGAKSIVASTVQNFGFVGGLVFIATVGFIMGRSRINATSPISTAFYCYLVGLLLFIFFRDPFQIQVKLVVTGILIMWLYRGISSLSAPVRRAPELSND
jgi:hypothetical protein